MTIRNLDALLAPKSVALIGASTRAGSVGLITARNMLAAGFGGPVWLVNPKHGAIEGSACHASLEALPGAPDLGIVVTPPAAVPGIVAELGAKGARAAVVITAGVRDDLKQAHARCRPAAYAAHPGPQLPRPDGCRGSASMRASATARRSRATSPSCRSRAR